MNDPKVSIIIPAFNAETTIERCIDSVIHQSLFDIEIIVVDDYSTDETPRVLNNLDKQHKRIRVIRNSANQSASYSRKVGIDASRGKYIMFVDADDQLDKSACETAYHAIEEKKVDILQFGVSILAVDATPTQIKWFEDFLSYKSDNRITSNLLSSCFERKAFGFTLWNKIYKADLIRIAASYVPDTPIYKAQDLLLQFFILTYGLTIDSIDNILYKYSYGSGITGGKKFNVAKLTTHMSQAVVVSVIYEFLIRKKLLTCYSSILQNIAFDLMTDNLASVGFCIKTSLESHSKKLFLTEWGDGLTHRGRTFDPALADFLHPTYSKLKSNPLFSKLYQQDIDDEYQTSVRDQLLSIKKDLLTEANSFIPVVMATNEAYIPYLAVAIESIKAHTKTIIFLFVFYTDLEDETMNRVKQMSTSSIRIEMINVSAFINIDSLYTRAHYSVEMYYRLIIAEMFSFLPKVLYLDCDIVVLSDLSNLFDINIGSYVLAAAKNPVHKFMASYLENTLQHNYKHYFNSGVLLINTSQFAHLGIKEKCLSFLSTNESLACPDQDALNIVCNGQVKFIDQSWNFQWHHGLSSRQEKHFADLLDDEKEDYYGSSNNIKILHYTSNVKPWNEPSEQLAEHFWLYAKKSPFFIDILKANIKRV